MQNVTSLEMQNQLCFKLIVFQRSQQRNNSVWLQGFLQRDSWFPLFPPKLRGTILLLLALIVLQQFCLFVFQWTLLTSVKSLILDSKLAKVGQGLDEVGTEERLYWVYIPGYWREAREARVWDSQVTPHPPSRAEGKDAPMLFRQDIISEEECFFLCGCKRLCVVLVVTRV